MIEHRDAVLNTQMHLWGWHVAAYLFLGGLAAGLLIFASWAHLAGRRREFLPAVRLALLLVPPIIVAGLFLLWLDLGSKWNPYWLYLTFKALSPMSWGAWILLVVLVTSVLAAAPAVHAEIESGRWKAADRWRGTAGRLARWVGPRGRKLAWTNLGLGISLGLYTGILLGTMVARPALNSPLLAPLFLVSGMSAAAALLLLLAPRGPWGPWLGRVEIPLHATKFALLALYIIGLATSTAAGQAAAAALVRGAWAWAFWPLVVAGGVVVPLGLALAEAVTHRTVRSAAAVSGALTLTGGLALRMVLVYAGQMGL